MMMYINSNKYCLKYHSSVAISENEYVFNALLSKPKLRCIYTY